MAFFSDLEIEGTNFKRLDASEKTVTCALNSPTSWTNNKVVLTVKRVKTKQTFKCTSDKGTPGFPSAGCVQGDTAPVEWDVSADGAQIKVTVTYTGKETAAFRCDVTIDDEASDTKLVYAEALDYFIESKDARLKIDNGERYMLWDSANLGSFPAYDLHLYGDNAEPNIDLTKDTWTETLEFEFETDNGWADVKAGWEGLSTLLTKKKRIVRLKTVSIAERETGANQDKFKLDLYSVATDTIKMFTLYEKCAPGEYSDSNGACKPCTEGVRTAEMNQLHGCKRCTAEGKMCPNAEFTECVARAEGQFCRSGWMCPSCPPGTYPKEVDNVFKCTPCPVGHFSPGGQALCTVCNEKEQKYTPAEGFSECLICGGHVTDNKCSACPTGRGILEKNGDCEPCPEGQYSNSGACVPCLKGTYTDAAEQSVCKPCEVGEYQDIDGQTSCKECTATEGKYSTEAGAATCTIVDAGYEIKIKDETTKGVNQTQCEAGKYANRATTNWRCLPCDAAQGKYQEEPGRDSCKDVGAGFFVKIPEASDSGATAVEECAPGTHRSNSGTNKVYTECTECDRTKGKYQDETGREDCKTVNDGSYIVDKAATTIAKCAPGSARAAADNIFTECVKCDWKKGKWQDGEGKATCKDVPEGFVVASDAATETKACPEGTARREEFFHTDAEKKFTECRPCDKGTYQDSTGQSECKKVPSGHKAVNDGKAVEECPAGTKEVSNVCLPCLPTLGEYQDKPGKDYCERVMPGYEAKKAHEKPVLCKAGTVSRDYKCVDCVAEEGEYQEKEEQSFCQAVNPGFELAVKIVDEKEVRLVNAAPVECKKGHYSKGSAMKCSPCDIDKKEYQNEEGATYCKICGRGKVKPGAEECEAVSCEEERLNKLELREEEFVFSKTAAGETLIIPCDDKKTENIGDKVYRHCNYDEEKNAASWGTPDYGKCPTKNTEKLNKLKMQTEALQSKEALASMNDTELANSMKDLSSGMEDIIKDEEVNGTTMQLTSRDVKDVAGTLDSIKAVIKLPNTKSGDADKELSETDKKEMKEATTALKKTMAKTIDKVAASGGDTLKTVADEQKTSIIQSVEALASSMEDNDEPIVTSTLAVHTIKMKPSKSRKSSAVNGTSDDNTDSEDESVSLPVPEGMEDADAPKLSLGDMEASEASVAVFSEGTKDMFPDPTSAVDDDVDDDDEEKEKDTLTQAAPKVNRTLNSAIVSLDFKGAQKVKFNLVMKSNTSGDASYKNKKLKRKCSFLNVTTKKWSSKGCTTTLIGESAAGSINCACDHNTSFAILLSISDIVDKSQDQATLIMSGINMTFLVLTFLCIAPFKKYRKKRLVVLQTQLVLSLILANAGFIALSEVEATKVFVDMYGYPLFEMNIPCYVGVIVVQYLFLVVMSWMTCCAYTLHGKIVEAIKTYGKSDRFYVHKCVAICWLLPAILPGTSFLTSEMMNNQENNQVDMPYIMTSSGKNGTDCWVANPWKWIGFQIPMYICLLINSFVFFMIVRVLIRAARSGSSSTGYGRQVKGAVSIGVTVGLPWITGALTFEPIAVVGQWLFIVLTGLQGPVMFIVFVILQEEVLGTLLQPLGLEVPEALKTGMSSAASARRRSSASFGVLSRETSYEPDTIDPVAAKMVEQQKQLEDEARKNVYSNEEALIEEAENNGSARANTLVVTCEVDDTLPVDQVPTPLPSTGNPDQDHLYYECTHFPYDPDAVSLASQYPEPVPE